MLQLQWLDLSPDVADTNQLLTTIYSTIYATAYPKHGLNRIIFLISVKKEIFKRDIFKKKFLQNN
jgi:hypothetical protein